MNQDLSPITEAQPLLQSHELFRGFSPATLTWLAKRAAFLDFPVGALVWEEGQVRDHLSVVVTGRVKVFRDYRQPARECLGEFGARDFFGEMTVLEQKTSSATVVAVDVTRLLTLRAAILQELAQEDAQDFSRLVANLARHLATRLRRLDRLFLEKTRAV
jgi:CRP-like cAMP-binding protein